jgi:hypothetical protein
MKTAPENLVTKNEHVFKNFKEFEDMVKQDTDKWDKSFLQPETFRFELKFAKESANSDSLATKKVFAEYARKRREYLEGTSSVIKQTTDDTPNKEAESLFIRRPEIKRDTTNQIAELKNIFKDANKFLNEHPEFTMSLDNEITELRNAPIGDPEKAIYENTMLMFKNFFRDSLVMKFSTLPDEKAKLDFAKKFTKQWTKSLRQMAGGDRLEYAELLPKKTYAPEVNALLEETAFLMSLGKLAESEDKAGFAEKYLIEWAKKSIAAGEASLESGTRFMNEAYAIMLQLVGDKHIKLEEFQELWKKIEANPSVIELREKTETAEITEKFEDLLTEGEPEKIIALREKKTNLAKLKKYETNSNPYGFGARKYGDLFSALLYGGEKVLYGILIANFALAGFDPIKVLKNPVMWATAGGVGLIVNRYHPLFPKTPEAKTASETDFKETLIALPESPTKEWLAEIKINNAVRELLTSKEDAGKITSAELIKCFPSQAEDLVDLPEIKADDKDGNPEKLFAILKACNSKKINPKKVLNA